MEVEEDGTDGESVLPLAVSKGKVVGAGARTVVSTPGCIGARRAYLDEDLAQGARGWTKDSEDIDDSADDDDDDDDETDQPLDVGMARRCSTLSLLEASASWRGDVLLSSLSFQRLNCRK